MIGKRTPGGTGRRRTIAGTRGSRSRRTARRRSEAGSHNERVRLITFFWSGRTGEQPVIFADRSWLQ